MLLLKPNCECCDKDLPRDSEEAMICSYECTFCRDCVETILENVCPNCGGGFESRPIRPANAYREGVSASYQEPGSERVLTNYSQNELSAFAQGIKTIKPVAR